MNLNVTMKNTAVEAAKIAGEILLENFGEGKDQRVDHKGKYDFVTQVDRQSEKAIIDYIRRRYPDHAFLAEESAREEAGVKYSDYCWIIDPLDGTTNYIHGFPVFSISIALEFKGKVILGIIYDPLRKEIFLAEKGKGAYLNENRIWASDKREMAACLLATGFPFRAKQYLDLYLQSFGKLFWKASGIRRAGSAALDLAYVGCGRLDGFWEIGLSPWDIAAGSLIITEGGGLISDFNGSQNHIRTGNVIAANRFIYSELLKTISTVFKGKL